MPSSSRRVEAWRRECRNPLGRSRWREVVCRKRSERLEFQDFVSLGIWRDDFFDGENFHGAPTAHIRSDQILGVSLIEANRLGRMREKIDGGRATQSKSLFGNVGWRLAVALAAFESRNEKDNLDAQSGTRGAKFFSAFFDRRRKTFRGNENIPGEAGSLKTTGAGKEGVLRHQRSLRAEVGGRFPPERWDAFACLGHGRESGFVHSCCTAIRRECE